MGRHSKQSSTREFFTSGERARASGSYGTRVQRLGADSQRRFGDCSLCLAVAIDPVASPSGSVYCRECILKNLLAQKQALVEQKKDYEEHLAQVAADAEGAEAAKRVAALRDFERSELSVTSAMTGAIGAAALLAEQRHVAELRAEVSKRIDNRDSSEKRSALEHASFWAPASTPGAAADVVRAPDPHQRDPISGDILRVKDLVAIKFTLARPAATDDDDTGLAVAEGVDSSTARGSDMGKYMCKACMKAIVFQKAYLFKPCGHVLCDKCVAAFVIPSKHCFVCSAPVTKADVIKLQQGGSSFASHEGTQSSATKYAPTLLS